jgi:hypothetical protein
MVVLPAFADQIAIDIAARLCRSTLTLPVRPRCGSPSLTGSRIRCSVGVVGAVDNQLRHFRCACWAYAIGLSGRSRGLGGVHIGTHYALAAGHRLALVGRPRVGLPLPMSAIGHDGVTVHPAVDACLVHVVMVGR